MRVLDDVERGSWVGDRLGAFGTVGGTVGLDWPSVVRVRPADPAESADSLDALARVMRHLPGTSAIAGFWEGYSDWRPHTWAFRVGTIEPVSEEECRALTEQVRVGKIAALYPALAHAGDHGPFLELPHRRYFLAEISDSEVRELPRSPNLVWPDTREWLVAVEVDADFALVGASTSATRALLEEDALEVDEVNPDTLLGKLNRDGET